MMRSRGTEVGARGRRPPVGRNLGLLLCAVFFTGSCTLVGFPEEEGARPTGAVVRGGSESDGSRGEGAIPDDIASIPDAVPRQEVKSRYGNPDSYTEFGVTYHVMETSEGYEEEGVASWYGPGFHGKRTSSGETYDQYAMTAAHTVLPLPTYVEVANLSNGRKVVVKVNDRGPFHGGRIIDLSYAAALKLGGARPGQSARSTRDRSGGLSSLERKGSSRPRSSGTDGARATRKKGTGVQRSSGASLPLRHRGEDDMLECESIQAT